MWMAVLPLLSARLRVPAMSFGLFKAGPPRQVIVPATRTGGIAREETRTRQTGLLLRPMKDLD